LESPQSGRLVSFVGLDDLFGYLERESRPNSGARLAPDSDEKGGDI